MPICILHGSWSSYECQQNKMRQMFTKCGQWLYYNYSYTIKTQSTIQATAAPTPQLTSLYNIQVHNKEYSMQTHTDYRNKVLLSVNIQTNQDQWVTRNMHKNGYKNSTSHTNSTLVCALCGTLNWQIYTEWCEKWATSYSKSKKMTLIYTLIHNTAKCWPIVADQISEGGNAIASFQSSILLFPFYLQNRLTTDLECLHVSRSWP